MTIEEIDVGRAAELLDEGVGVVDVRETDEYVDGHVPGAIHVPLAEVPGRLDEFPSGDGTYMVICKSGGRSMQACEFLAGQGHQVVNVAGGTMAWIRSGRDVVTGLERG